MRKLKEDSGSRTPGTGLRDPFCESDPLTPKPFPSYLGLLESGELDRRVEALLDLLVECRVCPRNCRVKRHLDRRAVCRTGRRAEVASHCVHRGEEPCISGSRGSGTVFFAHCNLACLFCQNSQISQDWRPGDGALAAEELAGIYLELQDQGVHNLNWVSPSHVAPQAVEALALAARRGLRIPIVYNSGGYDSASTLALLEGIVDVYMPDMKYFDETVARELSDAVGYVPNAQAALTEMWRQVGPLEMDGDGLARRGLLVRHLVLPNRLSQSAEVLRFLAGALGKGVAVSLLAQYFPRHRAVGHPLLSRALHEGEYARVLDALEKAGLEEGYVQELRSAPHYLPDFHAEGHPFERE